MPSDALGRTRTTLAGPARAPARARQPQAPAVAGTAGWNAPANQECLVGARPHRAPDASLPLVHTARRSYRLGAAASAPDCGKRREPPRLEEGEVVTRYP